MRAGDKLPRCADCKARTERVIVERRDDNPANERSYFLCASCEYLREHPDATRYVPPPRERRPKGLQKEVLFP